MSKIYITAQGYDKLQVELKDRKSSLRPQIIEEIAVARAHGDLSENAEYHAAREKQGFNDGRILDLENINAKAEIVDVTKLSGDKVMFGAKVDIVDDDDKEFTYQIVSQYEANVELGRISLTSPIARGLIGKEIGDYVEINTPSGISGFEILKVQYTKY